MTGLAFQFNLNEGKNMNKKNQETLSWIVFLLGLLGFMLSTICALVIGWLFIVGLAFLPLILFADLIYPKTSVDAK